MRRAVVGISLVIVAGVAVVAVAATRREPAEREPLLETTVLVYYPWNASDLPDHRGTGYCVGPSLATQREDAWRCVEGSPPVTTTEPYYPPAPPERGPSGPDVVEPIDPLPPDQVEPDPPDQVEPDPPDQAVASFEPRLRLVSSSVLDPCFAHPAGIGRVLCVGRPGAPPRMMDLLEPLPRELANKGKSVSPWELVLEDGTLCQAVPTRAASAQYVCEGKDAGGELDRSGPVWTIFALGNGQTDARRERVAVARF